VWEIPHHHVAGCPCVVELTREQRDLQLQFAHAGTRHLELLDELGILHAQLADLG